MHHPVETPTTVQYDPLRTALIDETDYIEYMCEKPGWSLLGDYKVPEQFDGDRVEIVYGRMRMYCKKGPCRYDVHFSNENPLLISRFLVP